MYFLSGEVSGELIISGPCGAGPIDCEQLAVLTKDAAPLIHGCLRFISGDYTETVDINIRKSLLLLLVHRGPDFNLNLAYNRRICPPAGSLTPRTQQSSGYVREHRLQRANNS